MKNGARLARSKSRYSELPIPIGLAIFAAFCAARYGFGVYFFFTALGMLAGLALAGYGVLNACVNRAVFPRAAMVLRRVVHVLVILGAVSFVIIQGVIFSGCETDATYHERYALVLGAGLDGETPSLSMQSRTDAAIEYWKRNPSVTFIACGGQGSMETITEAEAIIRALTRAGVPAAQIIREDRSTNTDENIRYAAQLLETVGQEKDAVVITNEFHLWRGKFIARRNGFHATGYAAKTPLWWLRVQFHLREYFSCIKALAGH